jgi:predicted metal-binding membrane protein
MSSANASPFPRERKLILALLLILAAASWALLIWQSVVVNNQAMGMGLTMGMSAGLFIAIWVVMMIAMMFPTAAPMILMFTRVYAGKRQTSQAFVPTWVFVSAYLLIWTLFGLVAYPLALFAESLAGQSMWLMTNAPRIGGAILVVAGLYQLSPLKHMCLSKCRTPLQFILGSWRDGYGGAFRMGFVHGAYCLGCCWFLFVLLFPLGIMNIAVMALLTVLIYAEKSFPLGRQISQIAGVALIV